MFKTTKTLNSQYELLKTFVSHLKEQCIRHRDNTRDIKTTVDELLPLLREASSRLSAVPVGLKEYAQQQEADPAYDVSVELAEIVQAVDSSSAWIVANIPTDPSTNCLLERVFLPDGSVYLVTVSDEKALEAVSQIQAVIDSIG